MLRSRHEAVNRRLKVFHALKHCFRHPTDKHHVVFRAVAVLTQLSHQSGNTHFDVVGYVDPAFEADW